MNNLMFHKVEIDTTKIESFVREGFESKLGKDNVLDIRLFTYPNEYIVAVTVREKSIEAQEIAHELQEIMLDNNIPVAIYTKEPQTETSIKR